MTQLPLRYCPRKKSGYSLCRFGSLSQFRTLRSAVSALYILRKRVCQVAHYKGHNHLQASGEHDLSAEVER